LTGCDVTIPITDGRLNLGQWQGLWLCEHKDRASVYSSHFLHAKVIFCSCFL